MRADPQNPSGNVLRAGVTEDDIAAAVGDAGYPLQTLVASRLRNSFGVVSEEWSYADRQSGKLRAIDVSATRFLQDWEPHVRVRPCLDLLLECKKSELPYVFFLSDSNPSMSNFPFLAGLHRYEITTHSDAERSTWALPILTALGLDAHPFRSTAPPYCMSFSKCVRKGKALELSGTESFHSLVLPLIEAQHHFRSLKAPPTTAQHFNMHMVVAVGVLDAPMVAVTLSNGANAFSLVPWVRVVRHESSDGEYLWEREQYYAIDVVHHGFLERYLDDHALPFAEAAAHHAVKYQTEVITGEALARGMGHDLSDIEERLAPLGTRSKGANRE